MADLPSAAPQMFQLPGPQVPYMGNLATGAAQGLNAGMQVNLQQQALAQEQQKLQMAKTQETISQVDALLKNGIELPGLLPSFWPAIAQRMNSLSPDYQLDPKNPPANILSFSKALSDISDGVQGGIVNMNQAHTATKQLIDQTFPNAQDVLGDIPTAGLPNAQGQPTMQIPQQQMAPSQPQQPPSGQPQGVVDPLQNFVGLKAQYDKANSVIAQAPLSQQAGLRSQLENSSLGLNYKKSLDQLATSANEQFTEGAQNQRNQFNQDQDSIRSLTSSFENQSQDAKNVFDNLNVFNSMMNQSRQFSGAKDTTGAVNAEKTALLSFAQMAYPGTGRPGNMEMLENMEKSGPFGTLIEQGLNKLDKGEIMTDSQIKGLRQAAVGIAQAREKSQSDMENTTANAIRMHGGNPSGFLRNYRPSSIVSTSKLFPSAQSKTPIIGQVVKGYKFLGGNASDRDNWIEAGND